MPNVPIAVPIKIKEERIDWQIIAIIFVIVANIIAIVTLAGFKEKLSGESTEKNFDYLDELTKINITIIAITSAFFLYITYMDYQETQTENLKWVFFANLIIMAAVIIKYSVIFKAKVVVPVESDI